ncbi:ATP synthase F1 subunit gamma [bacterium]|nr:ATP synthase F1 subunit gamma [bacterium]
MAKGGQDIRRRIRFVTNTQQVTKAMKMVAAARLRKSEGRTRASRPYSDTLREVMRNLSGAGASVPHPFLQHIAPDVPRVLLVLLTSEKGLCGSFNANLIRKAVAFIKEKNTAGREVSIICVGKKGYGFAEGAGLDIAGNYPSFTHTTTFAELKPLTSQITGSYLGEEVSEVHLLYARFIHVVKNEPTLIRLLPIEELPEEDEAGYSLEYDLQPSPEELLSALLPRYFQTVLFQAIIENFTSENGSRMVAMDNATNAAGDMIEELTLQYNKARQEGITLELLDIVGGAEALKG